MDLKKKALGRVLGSRRAARVGIACGAGVLCAMAMGQACPQTLPAGCYNLMGCENPFETGAWPFCMCEVCDDFWKFLPAEPNIPGYLFYGPVVETRECELRFVDPGNPSDCWLFGNPCTQGTVYDTYEADGIVSYTLGPPCGSTGGGES